MKLIVRIISWTADEICIMKALWSVFYWIFTSSTGWSLNAEEEYILIKIWSFNFSWISFKSQSFYTFSLHEKLKE